MLRKRRNGFLSRSQNVLYKHFFTLGFWVGLPQNLGFDFSVKPRNVKYFVYSAQIFYRRI